MKEIEPGKVVEITGTSSDAGELYVIRLTAENNSTKAEAFSVTGWSKFKNTDLRSALSGCVSDLDSGSKNRGSFQVDSKNSLEPPGRL